MCLKKISGIKEYKAVFSLNSFLTKRKNKIKEPNPNNPDIKLKFQAFSPGIIL
jgi:hypothetical protein